MTPVYLDFETYYSTTHSLTKMSGTEYVMHPDTEIISLAIKIADAPTTVIFGEDDVGFCLKAIDWSDKIAIGHNMSGFDSMIMAWRYGIKPAMWGCTAAMATSKYKKTCGVSLKALAQELSLGTKLDLLTKGKHLCDLSDSDRQQLEEYNTMDTELCAKLFKKLAKGFPKKEMLLIDMTTRMLVEPKFEVDQDMVLSALEDVKQEKKQSLLGLAQVLGVGKYTDGVLDGVSIEEQVRTELASSAKFGELLKMLGVPIPMKPSPTNPQNMTNALAKTDEGFLKLLEHPNTIVSAAARARLEVKSTILETRLEKFIAASHAVGGKLPVPLKYCGADTTGRWSGEQYNMQNLPRINPSDPKPSDALRMSLKAPKGKTVIVADLSGIELRVNMFLWKVPYAMKLFQESPDKADLYKYFSAHSLYDIAESEVTKVQRQVGKVSHLGLGFGAGGATFQKVAKLMGGVDMDIDEATRVVNTYRSAHHEIEQGWKSFQHSLNNILQGNESAIDPWGMCITEHMAVRLPSGRRIYYPELRKENNNGKYDYYYGAGRHKAKIYAGKGVENLVQALARDIIADNALEFKRLTKLSPTLMVHDELVYVVPDAYAETLLKLLQKIMRTPPVWWPELITWSEGDSAERYGTAK